MSVAVAELRRDRAGLVERARKVLARASSKPSVRAGEIVIAKVDLCMGNELSTSLAIPVFKALGCKRVKDPSRVTIVMSHFTPNAKAALPRPVTMGSATPTSGPSPAQGTRRAP